MEKNYFAPLQKKKEFLYIVAVSGGPDSTFLLYKMHSLGYRIVAAHLNYQKRYDSFCDEELVTEHCRKLLIKLFVIRVDSYEKGNFQAIARDLRYKFFSQIAEKLSSRGFKIGGVVIGHNFEDSLETYQLQKERKSLVSYWGLSFQSQFGKWLVFRPIISFRRKLIIELLMQGGIKYAVDYTNDTMIYRRNVIRKEIFALSEKEKNLLSEQVEKENILLSQKTGEVSRKIRALFVDDTLNIGHKEWWLSDSETRERMIYILLSDFLKSKFFLRKKRVVAEICRQLQSRKKRLVINIGSRLTITKTKEAVTFMREDLGE